MGRKKYVLPVLAAFLSSFYQANVNAETVSRRNIDVTYDYQLIEDSFSNVRKIQVKGTAQNNSMRMASKVTMTFTFLLKNRAGNTRKIDVENLASMETQSFDFTIDFSSQPVVLKSIICNIDQITFSAAREASPLTPYHLVVHELYSLARLNEEGKAFLRVLQFIRELKPFLAPVKDEFETTSEYEARVNNAENQHFSEMMDELEQRYGLLFGGANTRIRFLPRTMQKNLIYVSECTAYFHIPIFFGPYNADLQRFENVLMNPRTFPFAPQTHVPDSDLQFIHRSGMFFLRKSEYAIDRSEAKIWREQDRSLILEVTIRFGIKQDGPHFQDFCIVEKIVLKNKDSGEVFREWLINP